MTRRGSLGSFWLMVALAAATGLQAQALRVTTDSGVLVGSAEAGTVVFRGVPYASAPVGSLRWAQPQPAKAWTSERPATAYGANCPQKLSADGSPNSGGALGPISEDCLFLNVWAPVKASKAPVMVWLHGGGNNTGAGSLGAYEGGAFIRDGVVLVTLNYRLGALGFFAHPALTNAARPGDPLVNYGLMDQIQALQWVKRNIAAFGGDPTNVTLFGESAGGQDALLLLTAPSAQGLFSKAIVESGGGWGQMGSLAKREAQDEALIRSAGAPPNATIDQLRALPMSKLVNLSTFRGGPAVDGRLILETPRDAFSFGHYAHVPLIIGSNSFEASLLKSMGVSTETALAAAPIALKDAYSDVPGDKARTEALFTDGVMGAPARWIASKASRNPSFLYHFAYVAEIQRGTTPGAGHATEIPFVFSSWNSLGAVGGGVKPTSADLAMTDRLHGCWVSFARTSIPMCPNSPTWPSYSHENDELMDFDTSTDLKRHFQQRHYEAQESIQLSSAKSPSN